MSHPWTRALSLILAASLTSVALAGCGQVPTRHVDVPQPDQTRAASVGTMSASQYAADFVRRMEQKGVEAKAVGAIVSLRTAAGDTLSYDFSATPRTGKVSFKAGEYVTSFEYVSADEAVPKIVIALAIKMIWGGTKAYIWYRKTHQGSNFNREDCIKAVVYGMVAEGVTVLPGGVLIQRLVPVVWKWIVGEDPIHPTPKAVFQRGLKFQGEVVQILRDLMPAER